MSKTKKLFTAMTCADTTNCFYGVDYPYAIVCTQ